MAIIGKTLAVPEYGFTRYEFINKDDLTLNNEYFCGITASIIQDDNGLLAVGASNGGEILIKIKNTYRFRLLVCLPSSKNANTLYTNNMVVEIDGMEFIYDLTSNQNTTIIDNCLIVDISDLSTNSHIVKIYADGNNNDIQMINIQAIDIDTRGIVGFTRTMASMFEGCTNLKKDIIIPKNADIVENMFKNCTSMTHVRSNWDDTYNDSGIITEDCYSGCTSITHIDDVELSLNEYTNGLDNIPPEWGGYGYTKEYTGIYMVEILSPNYTFNFASDGLLDNGYISWGDGTTTQNEYSHTYVNAGVYTIKGKVHSTYETATDSMKLCLKEILQYPIYGNLANAFIGCTALISANISGNKYFQITKGRTSVFSNCTNLERVIALDTKLEKVVSHISAFQNCNKLREIIGLEDFIYNTQNLMSCFSGCASLQNFTLSEDSLKNCTSFYQAFYGCTSLTESPIKTFASDSGSLSIARIFAGCTNITDISGVTFGKNITAADDWYPPNLTTANNIKINCASLCGTHSTTNKLFRGCKTLKYVNNAVLGSNITSILHLFNGCSALESASLSGGGELTDISYLFYNCTKLSSVNISGLNLSNVRYAGAVFQLCSSLKVLENITLGGLCYDSADYYDAGSFIKYSGVEVIRNCTFTTPAIKELFCTDQVPLRVVENITIDESITDLSGMFENCIHLEQDIVIPSHITNCSEMFKNCTSMTHIHSNWNNSYTNEITSTGCYSGCTAVTHIDGKNVLAYEGDMGIDYVPSEWGGNGFTKSNTSILRINLTSNNYNVCLSGIDQPSGVTSWGDGTADTSMKHTYSTAGIYIIKTQKTLNTASLNATIREVLTDILGLSNTPTETGYHLFRECSKLKTVNIDDHILKNRPIAPLFYGSCNIEYMSAKNVTVKKSGFGCTWAGAPIPDFNNALTEIVGVDTWKIETDDLSYLFDGYTKLESLDISNWDLENVTNMSNMFEYCKSLTESPIENIPDSVTNISNMFKDCTNLTDISGMTFGSGITTADTWYPPNLITANNVTIKNDVVAFHRNPTLQYCNNLRTYYAKNFIGCTALVELKNLLIKSEDGTVISAYGANAYRTCSKLKIITFDPNCNIKYISCDYMFIESPLLEEVDFGGGVTLEPIHTGNSVFGSTPAIKTIKNMKVGGTTTGARFSGDSTSDYGTNYANLEYLDCTIMTQEASKFFKGSGIKDVSNIKFDTSIEDLSESFMNNRLLLQDVEVQSHIRNCSSMFKNCTALTHIRSNWDKSYDGGIIISTDCYSGCTAITHIDDNNIIAYEGDNGLNYIPTEWGGNGVYRYYYNGEGSFETTFAGEIERIPENEASSYLNALSVMTEAEKTSFVNALKDYSGQETAILYGASQYLSTEQIAIASAKNWTVT